jgi:ribosomal protein S27AE
LGALADEGRRATVGPASTGAPLARRCPSCDHDVFQDFPRLARLSPICWLLAAVALAVCLVSGWHWLTVAAGATTSALAGLRLFGGVVWWGGSRCSRCGATVMLR